MLVPPSCLIVAGCKVMLSGLKDEKLNGQTGTTLEFCDDTRRWAVLLGTRRLAVKAENLVLTQHGHWQKGKALQVW